jgi:hypothetical protein
VRLAVAVGRRRVLQPLADQRHQVCRGGTDSLSAALPGIHAVRPDSFLRWHALARGEPVTAPDQNEERFQKGGDALDPRGKAGRNPAERPGVRLFHH